MVFIPPVLPPTQTRKKNSSKRTPKDRHNSIRARSGMSRMVRTSLSTTQGVSTLKIVLIYSILGMILNWVLPILILNVQPDMVEDDAQYYGTLGAIVITAIFLIFSLVKGIVMRSSAQSEQSKTRDTND